MEQRLKLNEYGEQLWGRPLAREVRRGVEELLQQARLGGIVIIDASEVEVFDYSFANELFGKTILSLVNEYPGRFLVVENLTPYACENLTKALETLNLIMIERESLHLRLIGKVHPADQETFDAVAQASHPVSASELSDYLGTSLNAMNERLSKLTSMAILRRDKGTSSAGRQQYRYHVLA